VNFGAKPVTVTEVCGIERITGQKMMMPEAIRAFPIRLENGAEEALPICRPQDVDRLRRIVVRDTLGREYRLSWKRIIRFISIIITGCSGCRKSVINQHRKEPSTSEDRISHAGSDRTARGARQAPAAHPGPKTSIAPPPPTSANPPKKVPPLTRRHLKSQA